MKKAIIVMLFIAMFLLLTTGCKGEETPERLIPFDKVEYARFLNFEFQRMADGEVVWSGGSFIHTIVSPYSPDFDPSYTELVFYHSEAEAAGFPDNVIAA